LRYQSRLLSTRVKISRDIRSSVPREEKRKSTAFIKENYRSSIVGINPRARFQRRNAQRKRGIAPEHENMIPIASAIREFRFAAACLCKERFIIYPAKIVLGAARRRLQLHKLSAGVQPDFG